MPPTQEELLNDIESQILKLKEIIQLLIKLRKSCAEYRLELGAQDRFVCLEVLENMDQLTNTDSI